MADVEASGLVDDFVACFGLEGVMEDSDLEASEDVALVRPVPAGLDKADLVVVVDLEPVTVEDTFGFLVTREDVELLPLQAVLLEVSVDEVVERLLSTSPSAVD